MRKTGFPTFLIFTPPYYPKILKKCDNAVASSWFPSYTTVSLLVSSKHEPPQIIYFKYLNHPNSLRGISITQFVVTCLTAEHMLTTGRSCLMNYDTLWCTEKEMPFHFGFFLHFAKCNSISDFQHTGFGPLADKENDGNLLLAKN